MRERALNGDRETLVAAVILSAPPIDLPETGVRTGSSQTINDVDFRKRQQMGALATHIGKRGHDFAGKGLLQRQPPLRDISILPFAILRSGRNDPCRVLDEGIDRKTQSRYGLA